MSNPHFASSYYRQLHAHVTGTEVTTTVIPHGRVREIVKVLSEKFGTPAPPVRWSEYCPPHKMWETHTPTGGFTDSKTTGIVLGPMAPEDVLIHEFAHTLYIHRDGLVKMFSEVRGPHGERYYRRLIETIRAHYGDPLRYPWTNDYPHLRNWAYSDGYTKRPTAEYPEVSIS